MAMLKFGIVGSRYLSGEEGVNGLAALMDWWAQMKKSGCPCFRSFNTVCLRSFILCVRQNADKMLYGTWKKSSAVTEFGCDAIFLHQQ